MYKICIINREGRIKGSMYRINFEIYGSKIINQFMQYLRNQMFPNITASVPFNHLPYVEIRLDVLLSIFRLPFSFFSFIVVNRRSHQCCRIL